MKLTKVLNNWPQVLILRKQSIRKPSEQLFPNRRPLSYPNLTNAQKYENVHKVQTTQKFNIKK